MNSDFLDAHERHWEDAGSLLEDQRYANADHLYGMAAECGLKRLMFAFGMPQAKDGGPEGEYRLHVNELWSRYEAYRSGRPAGAGYALPTLNPFRDWNASQRYAHRGCFKPDIVEAHQKGAEVVRSLIRKAQKDGLI
ncbi:MAG: SAM-dependent methyltransferase [Pseudomonadota bacterium]